MRPFRSAFRLVTKLKVLAAGVATALVLGANPASAAADPLLRQQWALDRIGAPAAWARSTGQDVVVAVIDTGVNFSHEDLEGASAGSFTCIDECVEGGEDDHGHGTWVSGIIAARAGNGKGGAGVAPRAKIMSIKALDANGVGTIEDVARSIRFASDQGAKVINLSLGADLPLALLDNLLGSLLGGSDPFQAAIDHATTAGATVVAAAGNSGLVPGFVGVQGLLLVGATGPDDRVTTYSSSLLGVTLHAPGGAASGECDEAHCILTTDRGGEYKTVQGTSFAAPHVSGVLAQLVAMGYSPLAAAAQVMATADLNGGVRRLNAAAAVQGEPVAGVPVGAAGSLPVSLEHLLDLLGVRNPGVAEAAGLGVPWTSPQPAGPEAAAPASGRAAVPAPRAAPAAVPAVARAVPDRAGALVALPADRAVRDVAPATTQTGAPAGSGDPLPPVAAATAVLFAGATALVCHRLLRRPLA